MSTEYGPFSEAEFVYLTPNEIFSHALRKLIDRVIPAAESVGIYVDLQSDHPFEPDPEGLYPASKGKASEWVKLSFVLLVAARNLMDSMEGSESVAREFGTWEVALEHALSHMDVTAGYLYAIGDASAEHAKRGTNGKLKRSEELLELIRQAGAEYNGKMSKTAAAPFIAAKVHKSADRVKKLMPNAFPTDTWTTPKKRK